MLKKFNQNSFYKSESRNMAIFTDNYLKSAHTFCFRNRGMLYLSKVCGCFSCLKIFNPQLIRLWSDQLDDELF